MDIEKTLFWMGHASFYIKRNGYNIFIDPFTVTERVKEKADLILITHAHMDHCNRADIEKVMKPDAEIMCPVGCLGESEFKNLSFVKPGFSEDYKDVKLSTIPAYNNKPERKNFHPKANNWVGWIVELDGTSIYHAGDTDFIDEMKGLRNIGASLLPIGGTYTMGVDEAIDAAKAIGANYAIPMHYKNLLKEKSAAAEEKFKSSLKNALIMKEVQ